MAEKNSFLVWPTPQEWTPGTGHLVLSMPLRLATYGHVPWLPAAARKAADVLNRAANGTKPAVVDGKGDGATWRITTMENLPPGLKPVQEDEGYILDVTRSGVLLAGRDARGMFWGTQTLAQLMEDRDGLSLPVMTIRDWPRYPIRGAHCYLPAREHIDFFWRFLDFLAGYKCNTLVLEVAGGMEYKKHPEINEAWARFCQDVVNYDFHNDPSDKNPRYLTSKRLKQVFDSYGIQRTGSEAHFYSRYFPKDSQHPELAGGSWLTTEEIRRIKQECDQRHIEIIPEVQSLSHAYYLCCAHPDIAERENDPWPDTYCPSNPKTYELLFDVMDEVIAAFKPRIMHIGHDEAYTFGICPRCQGRSGADLLASDINTIHEYLASRGVRPLMWCDKLTPLSGVEATRRDPGDDRTWYQPPTIDAIDMVRKDLLICDYKYGEMEESESYFHDHGFEVVYGNFLGNFGHRRFPDWNRRADKPFVLGGIVSTWCEVSSYILGHQHFPYKMFEAADMLWHGKQIEKDHLAQLMVPHLAAKLDEMSGEPRWLVSGEGKLTPVDIGPASQPLPDALTGKVMSGRELRTVLGTAQFPVLSGKEGALTHATVLDGRNRQTKEISLGKKASKLILVHGTTMEGLLFKPTYGYYHPVSGELLRCEVTYADGKQERFSAYFGDDMGPLVGKWPTAARVANYPGRLGGYCHRAIPVPAGKEHTFFAQEWINPRPEVAITSLALSLGDDAAEQGQVIVTAVSALVT
jgi:hypothetical protein